MNLSSPNRPTNQNSSALTLSRTVMGRQRDLEQQRARYYCNPITPHHSNSATLFQPNKYKFCNQIFIITFFLLQYYCNQRYPISVHLQLLLKSSRAWLPVNHANVGIIHVSALSNELDKAWPLFCSPPAGNPVNNYAKRVCSWVNGFRGCLGALNMCPSCFRHPSAFVVCRALGRTPSYEAYP